MFRLLSPPQLQQHAQLLPHSQLAATGYHSSVQQLQLPLAWQYSQPCMQQLFLLLQYHLLRWPLQDCLIQP